MRSTVGKSSPPSAPIVRQGTVFASCRAERYAYPRTVPRSAMTTWIVRLFAAVPSQSSNHSSTKRNQTVDRCDVPRVPVHELDGPGPLNGTGAAAPNGDGARGAWRGPAFAGA